MKIPYLREIAIGAGLLVGLAGIAYGTKSYADYTIRSKIIASGKCDPTKNPFVFTEEGCIKNATQAQYDKILKQLGFGRERTGSDLDKFMDQNN